MKKLILITTVLISCAFTVRKLSDKIITDPFVSQMVLVSGGSFTMGCTHEQGSDCNLDEKPASIKKIKTFSISKYEITQIQWESLMGNNPSSNIGCAQCPVENVSWDDIQYFITKLNARTGKKYRLPTEEEWEYAARGGKQSSGFKYSGSNSLDEVGWYYENSGDRRLDDNYWSASSVERNNGRSHPVGQKKSNELGLFDMSGNVYEWCNDWYKNYHGNKYVGDFTGWYRVLRGGGWGIDAKECRVTLRDNSPMDYRNFTVGFRLVSDP